MTADAHSPGKRIGAQLQVHHLAHHAFAALQMKRRARAIRGPEAPSFPARIRIIDPPIQAFGEEAHRVGNAQAYKPSVHQRQKGLVRVACCKRHVPAQTKGVELVHPGVVGRLGRP